MKKVLAVLIIILSSSLILWAQKNAPSILHGSEAVEQLKRDEQYNSLIEALGKAQRADEKDDDENTNDAVGQTTKLFASDGGENDNFGFSIAIDGETAVIGAKDQDVGVNNSQGAAIPNAIVYLVDSAGEIRTTRSSTFGYYRFDEVQAGQIVIVGARFKSFRFEPQIVDVNKELTALYFFAAP